MTDNIIPFDLDKVEQLHEEERMRWLNELLRVKTLEELRHFHRTNPRGWVIVEYIAGYITENTDALERLERGEDSLLDWLKRHGK
jgi:hypothetical protein